MTNYALNWQPPSNAFPLSVHASGRYLVDRTGTPFQVRGDSSWWMPYNLSVSDQKKYFANRVARGFNSVLLTAIEHKGTVNKPPKDFSNALPFSKRLDGAAYTGSPNGTTSASGNDGQYTADPYSSIGTQAPDFTQVNLAYWQKILDYVKLANSYNLVVFLFPGYIGYQGGDQGWMSEMVANDAVTGSGGKSLLYNYGVWLATFFSGCANIVWIDGGDYGSGGLSGAFPNNSTGIAQKSAVASLQSAMRSVANQSSRLRTAHWSRPSMATSVAGFSFEIQSVYCDNTPADETRTAYAANAGPVLEIEGRYANDGEGTAPYRQYLWWVFTSGGSGFYGDGSPDPGPIWEFNTDGAGWQSLLDAPDAQYAGIMFSFFASIAWNTLAPTDTMVTVNGSSRTSSSYISMSAASDGSLAVGYVPNAWAASFATFTVDMTNMRGAATAIWVDPSTGATQSAGSGISNSGTHVFTPPGTNADGKKDWVLEITA